MKIHISFFTKMAKWVFTYLDTCGCTCGPHSGMEKNFWSLGSRLDRSPRSRANCSSDLVPSIRESLFNQFFCIAFESGYVFQFFHITCQDYSIDLEIWHWRTVNGCPELWAGLLMFSGSWVCLVTIAGVGLTSWNHVVWLTSAFLLILHLSCMSCLSGQIPSSLPSPGLS